MPAERSARVTLATVLIVCVSCLLLTTLLQLAPGGAGIPVPLRMAIVPLALLVIPGVLGVLLWRRELDLDVLDLVAAGFTLNLIGITGLCVLVFEAGFNITFAIWIVLGVAWLLFGFLVFRLSRRQNALVAVDLRTPPVVAALVVALVVASAMTLRIGGLLNPGQQPDREEEAEQIAIIQKIDALPRLSPDDVMYMPGVPTTYYYPTYHFAVAMVSHGASVEPLVAFAKFRGLATFLAVVAFYAAANALFDSRRVARVILAATVVMLFSGQVSHPVAGYYWGLLAPDGHEADFGLGVTILLEIFFALRFLRGQPSRGFFLVGTPLLLLASMTLHAREVAQIVSYVGAFVIMVFLFRRDDRGMLLRGIGLVGIAAVIARAYAAMIDFRVSHIAEVEAASAAFTKINAQPTDLLSGWLKPGGIDQVLSLLSPVPALVLLAVPFLLLLFPRRPGVLFLCGGVLFWTTVTSFDVLQRFLTLASYSEIIMTPTRYVHHFGFWTIGLVIFGVAWGLNVIVANLPRWQARLARIGAGAHAPAVNASPVASTSTSIAYAVLPTAVVVLAFATTQTVGAPLGPLLGDVVSASTARTLWALSIAGVALVGIWSAWRRLRHRPWPGLDLSAAGWAAPQLGAGLVIPGLVLLYFASPSPSLWSDFQRALGSPDVTDFGTWYAASPVSKSLPEPIRQLLKGQAPGRIVAAEGEDEQVLSMFVPDYVLNSGSSSSFSTDLLYLDSWIALQPAPPDYAAQIDWAAYRQQLQREPDDATVRAIQLYDRYRVRTQMIQTLFTKTRPIFSNDESDDMTLRFLSAWHVEYVLADTDKHTQLIQLLDSQPGQFQLVDASGSRRLYRVSKPG